MLRSPFNFVINLNVNTLTLFVNYVLNIFKDLYTVLEYRINVILTISVFLLNKIVNNLLKLQIIT